MSAGVRSPLVGGEQLAKEKLKLRVGSWDEKKGINTSGRIWFWGGGELSF